MMKAPAFWSAPPGIMAWLLAPLGFVYGRMTAWRMRQAGRRAGVPVICVGNLTLGGAGKTPTVLWLARELSEAGERPFVVSRGYGGRLRGPVVVDAATMSAADCGDEPLLISRAAPVIVARDRAAGADLAEKRGATVILLDDGLQNPGLAKDLCIAVIDGEAGVGNGFCFPAGPLRAPVPAQLSRVGAALVIGASKPHPAIRDSIAASRIPLTLARFSPQAEAVGQLMGRRLFAFAGIGRPEKFFATLRSAGLDMAEVREFPDHHPFSPADLAALRARAAKASLTLVTTEKDAVRLGNAPDIKVLPVSLVPADAALIAIVRSGYRP